ncbi:hypothetical protein BGZ61DRAFT_207511 [Ilyonectria robusta]|uniref:uncharacterized protein n=1 Tax=Ilyonectria robusta TaxID=1079257 RepID=UPI001E8E0317|nr:uncharacterized protein BGZ61DRAFT_207511 [Ilyonectria robusta]KAH8714186.1 hypothetical protein BGZ61DRAFT_207511 [Ilyonectria robusta]
MTAVLPSYREATARQDWLHLVASFVALPDYPALCLVDRRFWHVFAPRLWFNVLLAVRQAGLQSGDDLAWWFNFVFVRLERTQPKTRALVRVLDAREFAKDSYHFASDQQERSLNQSFKRALTLLPNLTCILLDGHADLDPGNFLVGNDPGTRDQRLLMLSIAGYPSPLPSTFFNFPKLTGVVYLDISGIPGSIWSMIQPSILPDLRILKIRNREVDDVAFNALALCFGVRLWSLDISENRITDAIIAPLTTKCFRASNLRSEAYFRVEGKLGTARGGTPDYGTFIFVEESEWSGSFSHPERYLADAPMYMADPESGPQEYQFFRSDGQGRINPDSADDVHRAFSDQDRHLSVENYRDCLGLTHLNLSNNKISAFGIEKLLRNSNGHLEELASNFMPLVVPPKTQSRIWPKSAMLYGILNAAHALRPLFSSNLRTLRLHHSVVTQIPALEMEGLSKLSRLYIAETSILSRSEQAYAQSFVPDMNPRLTSLTLTSIPRRSSGPLIAKLVHFLKLLSIQERLIHDASTISSSWRGSGTLKGLRHLRLEFESDAKEESTDMSEHIDAEELMNTGDQGFSFFNDERATRRPTLTSQLSGLGGVTNSSGATHKSCDDESDRVDGDFLTHNGEWNGEAFSVPVWIGPKVPSGNSVINEYRRLVLKHNLRDGVGPATTSQVIAGAPDKSYIFHTAWCMAIMPDKLEAPPWDKLMAMKDVLEELKQFRLRGRVKHMDLKKQTTGGTKVPPGEPHFFWMGKLEVSKEEPMHR